MQSTDDTRPSSSELARRRAASRDLAPGMILLVLSQMSLIAFDPDTSDGWYVLWALSPLVGIGLVVWAQFRILARSDERERTVELSAMAIGFGVVIVALAVIGILQGAEIGDLRQQVQITTVLGIAAWAAASLLLKRRVS